MSKESKIEWTDSTFNPWIGCSKVSLACDHCYAEISTPSRALGIEWGPGQPRRRTSQSNWKEPLRWNAEHERFFAEHGRRRRVFCSSLADVFDNEVEPQWRADLFDLIAQTPNLDWLLLTKRIGNVLPMLAEIADAGPSEDGLSQSPVVKFGHCMANEWLRHNKPPKNVWLGITVCNQAEADRDVEKLLKVPATVRFLSMEPLLGTVDLPGLFFYGTPNNGGVVPLRERGYAMVDWVIAGGESGSNARPMRLDWVRSLRDQCKRAGVPFFFKQWGEWAPESLGLYRHGSLPEQDLHMERVGKVAAGRELDGKTHSETPAVRL